MTKYELKCDHVSVEFSPTQFRIYARQHLECETAFRECKSADISPIPYFLLCRAIELELKARHLEHKTRIQIKYDYSHKLVDAYNDLPHEQKTLDDSEYEEFARMSKIYSGKEFEYVPVKDACEAFDQFPDLDFLRGLAGKLVGGVV